MIHVGIGLLGWLAIIFKALIFLAVIGLIVWLIVWAVNKSKNGIFIPPLPGPTPKEIAQARYARGEITQAEYKKIIADLEK